MYKILFVKSKYDNLYEVVDEKCEAIKDKHEIYLNTLDKHIKLKTNKLAQIKDNIYCIFDDDSLFILERGE